MNHSHVDPRVVRTRELLFNAFLQLTFQKDFKDITIKNITDAANVNRATFYSHFTDKYHLMETCISEHVHKNIREHFQMYRHLNEDTITQVFMSLIRLLDSMETIVNPRCKRSISAFGSVYEENIKKELEECFHILLQQHTHELETQKVKIRAVVLSSSLYGAVLDWKKNSILTAEQYIEIALPYIMGTILHHSNK